MRLTSWLAALLSMLVPAVAGAQVPVAIPNSPWEVTTSTDAGGVNPTCEMFGPVGRGVLRLTVLSTKPGVVSIALRKNGMAMLPGGQLRADFRFAGFPDIPLTGAPFGVDVMFNLTRANLPAWMHGFTAGRAATIDFPGTSNPPWTFDLRGTSAAIDAVQKCITTLRIAGVPAPFASPPAEPDSRCLAYDPAVATITGLVGTATGYGPPGFGENATDPKFTYVRLTPDRPVCVRGGAAKDFDDVDRAGALELFPDDRGRLPDLRPWIGKHVVVAGTIEWTQVMTEASTPIYMKVQSIRAAP